MANVSFFVEEERSFASVHSACVCNMMLKVLWVFWVARKLILPLRRSLRCIDAPGTLARHTLVRPPPLHQISYQISEAIYKLASCFRKSDLLKVTAVLMPCSNCDTASKTSSRSYILRRTVKACFSIFIVGWYCSCLLIEDGAWLL